LKFRILLDNLSFISYSPRMQIASALRRKRDEIAATIAAYEARIDAAKRDLTALDQAARLFDPEAEPAETAIPWNCDRPTKLEPPRESDEQYWTLSVGASIQLVARTHGHEPQVAGKGAPASTWTRPEGIPEEFFYLDWP
jgi:hypothetical protein